MATTATTSKTNKNNKPTRKYYSSPTKNYMAWLINCRKRLIRKTKKIMICRRSMLFSKDGGLECKGDSLIQRIIKELKDRINFGYVDLTLVIYFFFKFKFWNCYFYIYYFGNNI